jgi:predicted RNase H-like HicB family nuclease
MDEMRNLSLNSYIKEILKTAEYKKDTELNCVVAYAPILPGCITQANSYEEARDNLIDAIELWIISGLHDGQDIPIINDARLASSVSELENDEQKEDLIYA